MRMSKFWRVIAPVVAAGGLVAAGAIPAASASTAAYSVTIGAHSSFPKVSGHTLVVYKAKGFRAATISGSVAGAVPGDVATLWSEPFGAKAFTATTSTATVTTDPQPYSFSVTPSLATAYEVQVTTGTTVDVISSPVTVYVTEGGRLTGAHKHCTSTTCTFSYNAWENVPAGLAYKTETHKKFYLYLAVGYPKLPSRFTLDKGAKASKVKKISSTEFKVTFTWYITLHHGGANWNTTFCTKDTESKDGMGLPGSHGCGNKHLSTKVIYIG
jgi:hypothetical protein